MPESQSVDGFIADLDPVKTKERIIIPDRCDRARMRKVQEIVKCWPEDKMIEEVPDQTLNRNEPNTGRRKGSEAVA